MVRQFPDPEISHTFQLQENQFTVNDETLGTHFVCVTEYVQ